MKRPFTALLTVTVLLVAGTITARAQVPVFFSGPSTYGGAPNVPHIFMFESLEADTLFWGSYGSTPEDDADRDYIYWADWEGTPHQGQGSLLLDWGLFSDADWGGSSALQHFLPDTTLELYDFSDFTHINLWYNTLVPADPAATMRLKLHDASEGLGTAPSSVTEDWYSESGSLYQEQPGWKLFSIPLESMGNVSPGTGGFSRPGCPSSCWSGIWGNGELDLDKISGFQVEITGPQFGAVADSSTAGTVVWDNFYVSGVRYNLLHSFDDQAGLSHWKNSDAGSYTLTNVADTAEGTGALELDYNLVADQSWGGSVDIHFEPGGFLENMSARTHISVFYKVIETASTPGQVSLTFKLFDSSTGAKEEWQYQAGRIYDQEPGKWRRLLIPLAEAKGSQPGFAIPSWIGEKGDNKLDLDKLVGWEFQLAGATGTTTTGKILFDRMTGYGLQQTDFEAPAAVQGLEAAASEYTNIVSWNDVPEEEGEVYNLYASLSPITDLDADDVMLLERDVAEGTEVYLHRIFAPVVDQEVTYHYAITAADKAGNVSEVAAWGPLANTAKGLPSISLAPPSGFVADGDLTEWAGMTPFQLDPAGELGHVATGYTVTDAADLSADVYIAMDDEALYFAADVTDDAYFPVPDGQTESRWTFDGLELYIGLYDGRKAEHVSFEGEEAPDYKFYLYKQNVISDQRTGDIVVDGDGNYRFTETANGYAVEAKLAYDAFVLTESPAFKPMNGMRIPLDFVMMDNDLGGVDNRQGILAYSFWNDDNSYLSPSNWFYAWIGDKWAVDVERLDLGIPDRYALDQNYPNPFNPSTTIRYALPQSGNVTLRVFNVLGQVVETLVHAQQAAGTYEVRFDASSLSSGLYLYQLQAGQTILSKSMLLAK